MSLDESGIIITIRVIRSFEHRNIKHIVLKNVDPSQTVEEFITFCKEHVKNTKLPPPVRNYAYDTLKIQHKAFGSKTNDPAINTEDDMPLSVDMPASVTLEVTHTEPGVKGNTATNATKPATVETGARVNVPLFIQEGEKIRVDTRTGSYLERAK